MVSVQRPVQIGICRLSIPSDRSEVGEREAQALRSKRKYAHAYQLRIVGIEIQCNLSCLLTFYKESPDFAGLRDKKQSGGLFFARRRENG